MYCIATGDNYDVMAPQKLKMTALRPVHVSPKSSMKQIISYIVILHCSDLLIYRCNPHSTKRTLLHRNEEMLTILCYVYMYVLLHYLYRILGQLVIVITLHYRSVLQYQSFEIIMKDITSYN